MVKKSNALLICLLAAMLLAAPAFSQESKTLSMMGFEDADSNRVWADNLFFRRMEAVTGVAFTFTQFSDDAAYRARLAGMQPGDADMPDVLFKAGLSPAEAADLLARGLLKDLAPLIQEHMPSLSALMEQRPDVRRAVTLPDGSIPTLPFVALTAPQNALWVNQAWLDALGMEMPSDTRGFAAMLEAFFKRDPNRNGRADEVPLSFNGPYDLKYLAHAFGLVSNDFNVFAEENEVRFMPTQPRYREFIRWLRDMWERGLLDQNGFAAVDALRRESDKNAARRLGAFFAPLPSYLLPLEWAGEYRVMPPLAYEGGQVYRQVSSPVYPGAFALTSGCDDPAAALAWADYLYTQAGAVLAGVGELGADYVVDGDGTWRLLHTGNSSDYLANSVISSDFSAPGVSADAFEKNYSDAMVRNLVGQIGDLAALSVTPFPPFSLTAQEEAEIAPLQASIGRYVDESLARFVTGEWDVTDGQFEQFEDGLRERGLEAFLSFWDEVYVRSVR